MNGKQKTAFRETLLVIVLGFMVLYLILGHLWMLYTAVVTGIAGMLSLTLNRWIHQAWFFAGEKLGFVVSRIILGAIYFLVLVPMGLLSRSFRKDPLDLKHRGESGFHRRDHVFRPEDLENMW
jgi:hypothetical protein